MLNKLNNSIKNPFRNGRVFCFSLILTNVICFAQPQLKISDAKKSFGFVKKGDIVKLEYEFTNSGNQPLLITNSIAECSCTTVYFPIKPIMPNESAKIMVNFDTKSVYDRQDRVVEIISNSKTTSKKIRFKGVVLK